MKPRMTDADLGELANSICRVAKRGAAQLADLQTARQRVANLEGVIEALQSQLGQIPAEHQIAPHEAAALLSGAQTAARTKRRLETANGYFLKVWIEIARNFRYCEAERDEAEIEAARYKDLADALGRDGLQAKIIRAGPGKFETVWPTGFWGDFRKANGKLTCAAKATTNSKSSPATKRVAALSALSIVSAAASGSASRFASRLRLVKWRRAARR